MVMKTMQRVFTLHLNLRAGDIVPGVLIFPAQGLTSIRTKTGVVKMHHVVGAVRNLVTQGNSPNTINTMTTIKSKSGSILELPYGINKTLSEIRGIIYRIDCGAKIITTDDYSIHDLIKRGFWGLKKHVS